MKITPNLYYGLYTCKLLSSVLNDTTPLPLPEQLDINELYAFQSSQSVTTMAYCALKKLSIPSEQLKEYSDDYKTSMLREARFELIGQQVFDALEKAEIPFVPLKGVILKKLYPMEHLRSFTDYDIYIGDKLDEVKPVMESVGFELDHADDYHAAYSKKPSLNFEMHGALFGESYDFDGYFDKPFEKAKLKKGSKCCHLFTYEDFYIHVFCHMFKHFSNGGCGLRQFMDIYVLQKKLSLNHDYIKAEMEKLKLSKFYDTTQNVLAVIFDNEPPTEDILKICDYIFSNGTFGSEKIYSVKYHNTDESITKWKIKFFWNRWGLSYSRMKENYKILKYLPFLLPFCWMHKALKVVFFKRDTLKSQINDIESYNSDFSNYLNDIWKISGIDRNL